MRSRTRVSNALDRTIGFMLGMSILSHSSLLNLLIFSRLLVLRLIPSGLSVALLAWMHRRIVVLDECPCLIIIGEGGDSSHAASEAVHDFTIAHHHWDTYVFTEPKKAVTRPPLTLVDIRSCLLCRHLVLSSLLGLLRSIL